PRLHCGALGAVDDVGGSGYICCRNAGIAQLVEHNLAKVGVAGSSPVSRSPSQQGGSSDAGWSSLVARRAHNPEVVGSNPTPAIIECGMWNAECGMSPLVFIPHSRIPHSAFRLGG